MHIASLLPAKSSMPHLLSLQNLEEARFPCTRHFAGSRNVTVSKRQYHCLIELTEQWRKWNLKHEITNHYEMGHNPSNRTIGEAWDTIEDTEVDIWKVKGSYSNRGAIIYDQGRDFKRQKQKVCLEGAQKLIKILKCTLARVSQ